MGLYIRDDSVRELAAKIASAEHRTISDAVRLALQDRWNRLEQQRAERVRRTEEIVTAFAKLPELRPGFTDKDLYDANGLPVL